jgi:hypothetical protein
MEAGFVLACSTECSRATTWSFVSWIMSDGWSDMGSFFLRPCRECGAAERRTYQTLLQCSVDVLATRSRTATIVVQN